MARKKLRTLALKWGHPTPFRKTVTVGEGKDVDRVQLVFEPGYKYTLTDNEVEQLARFIVSGLLVDPGADVKGRYKDCREANAGPEETPAEEPQPAPLEA